MADVLVTGATGYLGRPLAQMLVKRGHNVVGLIRPGRTTAGLPLMKTIEGNALDGADVRSAAAGCDTIVHLVGTPHPAPWKQALFESIDAVSLHATASAAATLANPHVVYVSVAHPAPTMKGYIAVRKACEQELAGRKIRRTILRPWYVLGEGHWWPAVLRPLYRLAEAFTSTRESAQRLGLVSRTEMVGALVWAVERPPLDFRLIEVPDIRILGRTITSGLEAGSAEPVGPAASSRRA